MAAKNKEITKKAVTKGFLPDFSKYLFKDYPIDNAFNCSQLINKLKRLVSELITTQNPAHDLPTNGCCKKLEKMIPSDKKERAFIQKCNFDDGQIYYAAYGDNPYRIVFGIDSNRRIAYFFALDTTHSIRKG